MSTTALHDLLDTNLTLASEYGDAFSNHLPMARHALDRLGASDERLRAFFRHYSPRLGAATPPVPAVPLAEWLGHRGRVESLSALHVSFAAWLDRDGAEAVLRASVPRLMSGVGGAAFHGLLRTAHAFEAGHRGELARALAYWAARWMPLDPPPPSPAALLGFEDWAACLREQAAGWSSDAGLIVVRMQAAQSSLPYRALAGRWAASKTPSPAGACSHRSVPTGFPASIERTTSSRDVTKR